MANFELNLVIFFKLLIWKFSLRPFHKNQIPLLSEFKLSLFPDTERSSLDFLCVGELRFGKDEFEENGITYTVAVSRAFLNLQAEGMSIDPNSKYGEKILPPSVSLASSKSQKGKKTTSTSNKLRLQFNTNSGVAIDGGAGGTNENQSDGEFCSSTNEILEIPRVKAIGGDNWEVTEPLGQNGEALLDGKYLNSTPLCQLTKSEKTNRHLAIGSVMIKARDFELGRANIKGVINRLKDLSTNKDNLLKIYLTKELGKNNDEPMPNSVVISTSESELHED